MKNHEVETTNEAEQIPTGALTDAQRATFRSAGVWMEIVGWGEALFGTLVGTVWLFAWLGILPEQAFAVTPSEWSVAILQIVGSAVIGVLTLTAARSFRRAGRDPNAGLPEVTTAVADLAELYERQVWLAFALFAITIGGALAKW